jgi:hypothetical protein
MASATSPCQVVLSLAHLLKQHQPHHALTTVDYYEIEKSALLTASVQCATELASVAKLAEAALATGTPLPMTTTTTTTVGEVHLIMTGSPRPTFAETNAWLLEDAQQQQQQQAETPEKKKGDVNMATGKRPELLAGSLSILDNHVSFATVTKDDNDMDEDMDEEEEEEGEGNNLEQLLLSNATPPTTNTNFIRRHTAPASSTTTTITFAGPMVGQAVVNAINQTIGVGLQSNRSKLLQGTIDRPEWIQSRWTDGECVFGELVHLCGLHSFENTSAAGGSGYHNDTNNSSLTEEKKDNTSSSPSSSKLQHQLRKTTNLSAHLITVPVILSTTTAAKAATTSSKGIEEETMEEIARGILRCLKRKGSTSVSNIYLLVPPSSLSRKDTEGSAAAAATATIISALLKKAFDKLEQYNDMIGMPRVMANVCFEVVPVVCNYDDDKRKQQKNE